MLPKLQQDSISVVISKYIQDKIPETNKNIIEVAGIPHITLLDVKAPDTTIGFWDLLYTWGWFKTIHITSQYINGGSMPDSTPQLTIWDSLQGYLTSFIVSAVLKVGGGFLVAYGIQTSTITAVVGAVIAALGTVISSFIHRKAVVTDTPVAK